MSKPTWGSVLTEPPLPERKVKTEAVETGRIWQMPSPPKTNWYPTDCGTSRATFQGYSSPPTEEGGVRVRDITAPVVGRLRKDSPMMSVRMERRTPTRLL